MRDKGMLTEYIFLIAGLLLVLLLVSYWQTIGLSLAEKRWGELKGQTTAQIKNVLLLMQKAPPGTETCVQVSGCTKLAIHKNYVEIWGPENDYFKEPAYLSTTLSLGMLDIYTKKGESRYELLDEKSGFVTTCGSQGSIFFVCFRKDYIDVSNVENWDRTRKVAKYVEIPPLGSRLFEDAQKVGTIGTHELGIIITKVASMTR